MLLAAAAHGQSLAPRALFIDDRGAELFDTEGAEGGIRSGGFEVRAAAGLAFGMDSNVYALPESGDAQSVATGEAMVRAINKSTTREILGLAFVRARRFEEASDQDATEFGALARYDGWIGSQDRLIAGFSAEHGIESRNDIETPTTLALSPYDNLRLGLTHAHLFNSFALESRLDARRLQYDAASQEYRDRFQYRAELRGAYQLRSDLSWVVTGYYNRDEFDDPSPNTLSAGTAGALLGLHFDVSELLELELGAGYFERSYDDLDAPLEGISLRGTLSWHPTRLTSVRAQVLRTDAPTHIEGAFGKVRNDALLRVTHEYSRNLVLHAGARFIADDFETIDRIDTSWLAELGATWAFGRHSVLRVAYDYGNRNHYDAARSFDRHVGSVAYIMRL